MPIEMKIKIAKYLSLPFNSISKKFYRSHFVELIGPTVNNWGHSTIEYSIPQIMHASNASPARANYSSFQSVISFNIDESRVVLLHTRVEQKNSIFILRLPHETETRNISELFARTFRSIVSCGSYPGCNARLRPIVEWNCLRCCLKYIYIYTREHSWEYVI